MNHSNNQPAERPLPSTEGSWDGELRPETEEEYLAIKPLVEIVKIRYPDELNIEGLEPALTSDIAQIAVAYANTLLARREREMLKEKAKEIHSLNDVFADIDEDELSEADRGYISAVNDCHRLLLNPNKN